MVELNEAASTILIRFPVRDAHRMLPRKLFIGLKRINLICIQWLPQPQLSTN